MLQLEINLCFFAFYELVPDWRRITHNGPGEEQKQSQSGKCQYPDWGITWFITVTCPPSYWSHNAHTGLPLVTEGQSLHMALCKQWTIHYARPLSAHRTPVSPLSINFSSFLLFWLWRLNTEQCLFCLQQLPRYFPHLDLTSQSICPDYFLPQQKRFGLEYWRNIKEFRVLTLPLLVCFDLDYPSLHILDYIHGTAPDRVFAWQQLINSCFITGILMVLKGLDTGKFF